MRNFILFDKYYSSEQIEEDKMSGALDTCVDMRDICTGFDGEI
jgi:hypothetical protein